MNKQFKSGFVALVGRPNVGKSSLLNQLVGQKIAIISDKPQTTRNRLRGLLTTTDYQIVLIDTPGLHRPIHKLGDRMNRTTQTVMFEVDIVIWVLDVSIGLTAGDHRIAEKLRKSDIPVYIAWNKVDLETENGVPEVPGFPKVLKVSALTGVGIPELVNEIVQELPVGPAYYPADLVTDHPEQFIAAEFIREQVLRLTTAEVPHSIAVQIEEMKERENGLVYIRAVIHVERESQKGIIIGAKGERLKEIGQVARQNLEELLEASVYLDLWVKVRKDWRNNEVSLREFGYGEQE